MRSGLRGHAQRPLRNAGRPLQRMTFGCSESASLRRAAPAYADYLISGVGVALGVTETSSCLIGSGEPLIPSLNPRRPSPRPLPRPGSLLGPKMISAIARTTSRCVGCSSSPIMAFLPASASTRNPDSHPCSPLSHKAFSMRCTERAAGQMHTHSYQHPSF